MAAGRHGRWRSATSTPTARLDILKTHFADDIPALYRNRGRGLFEDVATQAGLGVQNRFVQWGAGPARSRQRRLDGRVLRDRQRLSRGRGGSCRSIRTSSPRIVFRNRGGGRFADVSASSGPGVTTPQSSRGAAFGDFDNDGDVDVLVMNMNAPPSLLRNDCAERPSLADGAARGDARRTGQGIGATVLVTERRTHAGARRAQPDELLLGRRSAAVVRARRRHGRRSDRSALAQRRRRRRDRAWRRIASSRSASARSKSSRASSQLATNCDHPMRLIAVQGTVVSIQAIEQRLAQAHNRLKSRSNTD